MKNKIMPISLLLTFVLLVSVSTNVAPVHAVPTVGVIPGDLLQYQVSKFSFDTVALEISDAFNYSGNLAPSTLWVKILDVKNMPVTYWDPTSGSMVTGQDPIVDVTVGAILGNDVTLHTEAGDILLPSGSGMPIPFLFGTVTRFNASMDNMPESILPIPVVLNNDWNSHEATLEGVDGISVTQTSSEFIIQIHIEGDGNVVTDGSITYDKVTAGILKSAQVSVTNSSTSETYLDISLNIDQILNLKSTILPGDKAKLKADSIDFTYQAFGDADSPDTYNVLNNITQLDGKDLIKINVKDTTGLYYLASLEVYDVENKTMVSVGDHWFNAFGIIPFGPINHYGDFPEVSPAAPMPPRDASFIGFFTSPDFHIYHSWFNSLQVLSSDSLANFFEFLEIATQGYWENVSFYSSNSDKINVNITSSSTDTATELTLSATIDFDIIVNDTWREENHYYDANNNEHVNTTFYTEITSFTGSLTFAISYFKDDPVRLNYISTAGNLDIKVDEYTNGTQTSSGQLKFNNIDIKLGAYYDLVPRATNTTSSTTSSNNTSSTTSSNNTSGTTTTSPALPLPGMTGLVTISSLAMIALVIYRKRN